MNLKHMALMRNVALTHVMVGNSNSSKLWRIARDAHLEELRLYERGHDMTVTFHESFRRMPRVPEKVLDELVLPIFPNPIKRDTFTFKVKMPKKGEWVTVATWPGPGGHFDVYAPALPIVNVGTIGHVDFGRNLMDVAFTRASRPYETNF